MMTDIEKGPIPMFDHMERAEEYLRVYKMTPRQGMFDWARYLLIGHAVEVALKAYLLPRGRSIKELAQRPFRHDLDALLADAKAKGLEVSADVDTDIAYLNHVHDNYLARYPDYKGKTSKGIVVVEELEATVEVLMTAIRKGT